MFQPDYILRSPFNDYQISIFVLGANFQLEPHPSQHILVIDETSVTRRWLLARTESHNTKFSRNTALSIKKTQLYYLNHKPYTKMVNNVFDLKGINVTPEEPNLQLYQLKVRLFWQ